MVRVELQQQGLYGFHMLGEVLRMHQLGVLRNQGPPDTMWFGCRLAAAGVSSTALAVQLVCQACRQLAWLQMFASMGWEGCGKLFRKQRWVL